MKINKIILILSFLLVAVPAVNAQKLSLTVNRTDLTCSGPASGRQLIRIMFDKSLQAEQQAQIDEILKDEKGKPDFGIKEQAAKRKTGETFNPINGLRYQSAVPDNLTVVPDISKTFYVIRLSDARRYLLEGTTDTRVSNIRTFTVKRVDPADNAAAPIDPMHESGYVLIANGISTAATMIPIAIADNCRGLSADLPKPDPPTTFHGRTFLKSFKSVDKEADANIVSNFAVDGSQGERRYLTIDVDFKPKSFNWIQLGGLTRWDPLYLKLHLGRDKNKDISTFEVGTRLKHFRVFGDDARGRANTRGEDGLLGYKGDPYCQNKDCSKHDEFPPDRFFPGISSEVTGKLESDLRFNTVNVLGEFKTGLPFNILTMRHISMRLEPFIGIAIGPNLKDQAEALVLKSDIKWIVRPFVGAKFQFSPFRKDDISPVIVDVDYFRRWPVSPEPFYYEIGDKAVFSGKTTRVRDYAKAVMNFNFGKLITPFVQYEWGREPPQYLLNEHRFKAGFKLTFKYEDYMKQ